MRAESVVSALITLIRKERVLELNTAEIMARLPHRYPMLLIDRVLELVPKQRIVAIKNVSASDSFFAGSVHPSCLAMPATLIIEAMAQGAALFSFAEDSLDGGSDERPASGGVVYYFLGIDDAEFFDPVVPGDCLRIEVQALRLSRGICKYQGCGFVGDRRVAQATLLCAIRAQF